MPCVFCNKPTSNDLFVDFEGEEVDGDLRPVCVRPNCNERQRYGVLPADSVSDLARTKIDLDRIPDPVLCRNHFDALR